jgi:hypothetical protein
MVQLYPPGHPIDPDLRNGIHGPEYARAITIGDDVWVGGSVIIMGAPHLALQRFLQPHLSPAVPLHRQGIAVLGAETCMHAQKLHACSQ